jgi:hypothetical protein
MEFSRCSGPKRPKRKPPRRTVSQNSAAIVYYEVNVILGDLVVRTNQQHDSSTSQEPPE